MAAGGGGGETYEGFISTVVNYYAESSPGYYTISANFYFASTGFSGAKLPYLTISSSSGGTTYVDGNRYDNDPLTREFTIAAQPGDTITVSSAHWADPSESGSEAYLSFAAYIMEIPDTPEPGSGAGIFGGFWGATWGGGAWGGIWSQQSTQVSETDITGQVRIEITPDTSLNGQARIRKKVNKTIITRQGS